MAGDPLPSPRALEQLFRRLLATGPDGGPVAVRLIRSEHGRALVEVAHTAAAAARIAWNTEAAGPGSPSVTLRTRRTYGTLRKGKLWIRAGGAPLRRSPARVPRPDHPRPD